jgi:hypothetical protein
LHLALASEAEQTLGAALPVARGKRVAAQLVHKLLEQAEHILLPVEAAHMALEQAEHILLPVEAAHMARPKLKQAPEPSSAKT